MTDNTLGIIFVSVSKIQKHVPLPELLALQSTEVQEPRDKERLIYTPYVRKSEGLRIRLNWVYIRSYSLRKRNKKTRRQPTRPATHLRIKSGYAFCSSKRQFALKWLFFPRYQSSSVMTYLLDKLQYAAFLHSSKLNKSEWSLQSFHNSQCTMPAHYKHRHQKTKSREGVRRPAHDEQTAPRKLKYKKAQIWWKQSQVNQQEYGTTVQVHTDAHQEHKVNKGKRRPTAECGKAPGN